ncbi:MAG: hypothetical protein ABJA98_00220 [Acidobacteriota bacterium]
MDFLVYLEQSQFSIWVRESGSLFAFPGILLLHTYGMAVLVGIVLAIDLRILGFAPGLPLAPIGKFLPLLWVAFWINAATGTILLIADATTKMTNPDFFIKMGFIFLAVIVQRKIQSGVFRAPQIGAGALPPNAKILAVVSMTCWLGAITAGRLLAYVGPVSGLNLK